MATHYDKALMALVRIASGKHEDGTKLSLKDARGLAQVAIQSLPMSASVLIYQAASGAPRKRRGEGSII